MNSGIVERWSGGQWTVERFIEACILVPTQHKSANIEIGNGLRHTKLKTKQGNEKQIIRRMRNTGSV